MAEFKEVMEQAQRMCEYRRKRGLRCNDCDAVHICGLRINHVGLDTLCADADAVMLWAKEHPVEYPYMIDVLYDVFNMPNGLNVSNAGIWEWLNTIRISEEMAVKLGIEPKEN